MQSRGTKGDKMKLLDLEIGYMHVYIAADAFGNKNPTRAKSLPLTLRPSPVSSRSSHIPCSLRRPSLLQRRAAASFSGSSPTSSSFCPADYIPGFLVKSGEQRQFLLPSATVSSSHSKSFSVLLLPRPKAPTKTFSWVFWQI